MTRARGAGIVKSRANEEPALVGAGEGLSLTMPQRVLESSHTDFRTGSASLGLGSGLSFLFAYVTYLVI